MTVETFRKRANDLHDRVTDKDGGLQDLNYSCTVVCHVVFKCRKILDKTPFYEP